MANTRSHLWQGVDDAIWLPVRMARTDRVLRPFWLHQASEYLVGIVIVVMGLQTVKPAIPVLAGGLVLLNAALVDGPLGAFRLFTRRGHRIADLVVIGLLLAGAVLPTGIDSTSRLVLGAAAVVLAIVWWNSAFETRASRRAAAAASSGTGGQPGKVDRSQSIGRGAGRLAGTVAKTIRDRQKSD